MPCVSSVRLAAIAVRLAAPALASAILCGAAEAQTDTSSRTGPVTGWQPLKVVDPDTRIPAAGRADMVRQAEAVLAAIQATPAARSPGVEIVPEFRTQFEESGPHSATLMLSVYPPLPNQVDDHGRPRRAIANNIEVTFNDLDALCSQGCREAFLEPQVAGRVAGLKVYEQVSGGVQVLFLSARTAQTYLPVTQEQMVRNRLRELEEPLKKSEAEARARRAEPPALQAWLRERAQRVKEHEALIAMIKSSGGSAREIAEARANFQQVEKETEAMLREQEKEAPALHADENRMLADTRNEIIAPIERRLAGMSAAERTAQAYGGCSEPDETTGLCQSGAEGARRYVSLNPAFYDQTLPRSALQVAAVLLWSPPKAGTPVGVFVERVWETTDWNKVQALLR